MLQKKPLLIWALLLMAVPFICPLSGCFQKYYKTVSPSPDSVAANYSTKYSNRYFILRNGSTAYYMSNMILSDNKQSVACLLDTLPAEHRLHLRRGRNGHLRYKGSLPEATVLSEVHLYIPVDTTARQGKSYTLSLGKVTKVEVIEKDKGLTTSVAILSGVGIVIGTLAVAAIIIAATKSSCPFVSAYDGAELRLQGEIYGGAIYPQLCRDDYLKLDMAPTAAGMLRLQISNELQERQYTDLAELLVIQHDKKLTVLPDPAGNPHAVSAPLPPDSASSAAGNALALVSRPGDNLSFKFDDTLAAAVKNNDLMISWRKPQGCSTARLVLRVKNSYWLDLVYGRFIQGFGKYYSRFIKNQSSVPIAKLQNWKKEQQMPLMIELYTRNGWQVLENLNLIGPVANRELAIPIDLRAVAGDRVKIRLSAGFMFWEIDYAGMDFSPEAELKTTRLLPLLARDETGADVRPQLLSSDGYYLEQPQPGNSVIIEYPYTAPADSNSTQTYLLHTRGYYEHVRHFTTGADIRFLNQFRRPGALSDFSIQLYKQTMNAVPPDLSTNKLINK